MADIETATESIGEPGGGGDFQRQVALRRRLQRALWVIVVITIVGGLFYPPLGFVVPVVMLTGIIGGLFKGR